MILDEILDRKRTELAAARAREAPEKLAQRAEEMVEPLRDFAGAIARGPDPRVIAEVKRRSPSRGEIRADFDPVACAVAYAEGGAAAISILTDESFFGGHLDYLAAVRRAVALPLLRKDFAIDAYQVDEARVAGADAVLLIAAALRSDALAALRARAEQLGLCALVEVHDEAELEMALASGARVIGINNRDLRTFETDLGVTERLAPRVPEGVVVVAESGIFTRSDMARLAASGAHAFLVGESLMREADVAGALQRLRRAS
ncbi:MAG TPA: indole-3-glycerol phosphate synthase TrpC [Myxococcota bacterium]|nr:indole-3-glycerol phosphate synthase TrpC [Myxococcota bacterium]